MVLFPFLIEPFQKYHLKTNICHLSYQCLAMLEIAFVRNVVEEEMFGSASLTGVFDGVTAVVEGVVLYFEAVVSIVVVDVEEVVV